MWQSVKPLAFISLFVTFVLFGFVGGVCGSAWYHKKSVFSVDPGQSISQVRMLTNPANGETSIVAFASESSIYGSLGRFYFAESHNGRWSTSAISPMLDFNDMYDDMSLSFNPITNQAELILPVDNISDDAYGGPKDITAFYRTGNNTWKSEVAVPGATLLAGNHTHYSEGPYLVHDKTGTAWAFFFTDTGNQIAKKCTGGQWSPPVDFVEMGIGGILDVEINPLTGYPGVILLPDFDQDPYGSGGDYQIAYMYYTGTSWSPIMYLAVERYKTSFLEADLAYNPSTGQPAVAYTRWHSSLTPQIVFRYTEYNGNSWNTTTVDSYSDPSTGINITLSFNPKTSTPSIVYSPPVRSRATDGYYYNNRRPDLIYSYPTAGGWVKEKVVEDNGSTRIYNISHTYNNKGCASILYNDLGNNGGNSLDYISSCDESLTVDLPFLYLISQTQVSQLYVSIFGRASEGEGNTYWQSGQSDMAVVADTMLNTEPAKTYFGSTLNDDKKFIEFIYENTLGKTYAEDLDGVNYWVNELANGKSKGEVVSALINAAIDPAYAGMLAQDQFINKVTVSNYTADTITTVPDVTDLSAFVGFVSNVTYDSTTVVDAKVAVDAF